ncbi:cytidylyltransferase domain-containing protein [Thalassospira alkalitolerans]|uniref:cytidylyltransferase domain-containing protein n=1 Tax=Thalassospira alkalitolerans TaxID=1293890 RepID=UPI0030EF5869
MNGKQMYGVTRENLNPIGFVIFARLDSNRLPGKALLKINGIEMLGRVISRVREASVTGRIIVATTDRDLDNPIVSFADAKGIEVYRGSCDDVLGRAVCCARDFKLGSIVRICGDSPFLDAALITDICALGLKEDADIYTNIPGRTFPYGASIELIPKKVLERLDALVRSASDREHVTKYIYDNGSQFKVSQLRSLKSDYHGVRLVVDTSEDLARAEWIASVLDGSADNSLDAAVAAAIAFEVDNSSDRKMTTQGEL